MTASRFVVEKADWPAGQWVVRDKLTGELARSRGGYIFNDSWWHAMCRTKELNERHAPTKEAKR